MASSIPPQERTELAKHVSKVIADYIDDAITSLPTHQPFQPEPPFDIFEEYEIKADDPEWLERYSDQAINLVRRVLEFTWLYIPSSAPVLLKDPKHHEFVYIVQANLKLNTPYKILAEDPAWLVLYTAKQINQVQMVLDARRPYPLALQDITQHMFDEIIEAFGRSAMIRLPPKAEGRNNDEGSLHTLIEEEDAADANDSVSEADDMDNDDDIHDFEKDGEDDYDESDDSDDEDKSVWADDDLQLDLDELDLIFERWDRNEAKEALPTDTVSPLLLDPSTQKIALDVLKEFLDIPQGPIPEVKATLEAILRDLRKRFRVAHTYPFFYTTLPELGRRETAVMAAYLALASAAYVTRSLHRRELAEVPPEVFEAGIRGGISDLRRVKHWLATLANNLKSFETLLKRARAYRIQFALYMTAIGKIETMRSKLSEAFKTTGTKGNRKYIVKPTGTLALKKAVEEFAEFEQTEFSKESVNFPDSLIKVSQILKVLWLVREKCIDELAQNSNLRTAAHIADSLFNKWRARSLQSTSNSLYVSL